MPSLFSSVGEEGAEVMLGLRDFSPQVPKYESTHVCICLDL